MDAQDLRRTLQRLPDFVDEEGTARFWVLAEFNGGHAWLARFEGESPWERHPDGDELLHVLEGEVQVLLMGEGGSARTRVRAGSVLVVPRGVWHRQIATGTVVQCGATAGPTEHASDADSLRAVDA